MNDGFVIFYFEKIIIQFDGMVLECIFFGVLLVRISELLVWDYIVKYFVIGEEIVEFGWKFMVMIKVVIDVVFEVSVLLVFLLFLQLFRLWL